MRSTQNRYNGTGGNIIAFELGILSFFLSTGASFQVLALADCTRKDAERGFPSELEQTNHMPEVAAAQPPDDAQPRSGVLSWSDLREPW